MEYKKRETIIITDSASDLNESDNLKHTKIVPYKFYFKGDENTIYQDISKWSSKDYFARLSVGIKAICTTLDYDILTSYLNDTIKEDKDVIILYSSNIIDPNVDYVLESIKEQYQSLNINMNIATINTNLVSLGTGLLVRKCDSMIESGIDFDSIVEYVLNNKKYYNFEFFLPSPTPLLESKVISSRKILLSNLLKLDNIYSINSNRIYIKRRIDKKDILNYLYEDLFRNADTNEEIGISYINQSGFVERIEDKVKELYNSEVDENHPEYVKKKLSKTNGTYMGSSMIGISYKSRNKSSNNI